MHATGPWALRGSESFDLESKSVGDTFAIGVWQPDPAFLKMRGISASSGLDVLYVLDGSWALNVAASLCMLQMADLVRPGFPPLLVVGVDYPEGRPNARTRDYTPADDGSFEHSRLREIMRLGSTPELTPGGAQRFLAFLETELDPLIRSRYRPADRPAGIMGVSYGGSFVSHAFVSQSRLFNRYWLGSPGLFTSKADWVGQFERVASGSLVHDTKMFMSFGELEAWGAVPFYEDMGRNFGRLTDWLARHPNPKLQYRSKFYPGHTHTSVVAPAMNDALLYLYGSHFPG
ncbi:MAG: alpha/beta hydrolase [Gemmatimonadales bacterium]